MNLSGSAVLVIALLAPLAAPAQDISGPVSMLEAASYPPLSRQARIQREVRLRSGPDGVTVISGHPLLAPTAVSTLKGVVGQPRQVEIEAIYHFVLVDPVIRVGTRVEKKGNRFERLVLHAFMMKTERVVEDTECVERPIEIKTRLEVTGNGFEMWIYGAAACPISSSQIALR